MIEVYHAKIPNFGLTKIIPDLQENNWPDDFFLIATVDTDNLGEAFQKTNHIVGNWTLNEGVHVTVQRHDLLRSTSVGDVLKHGSQVFRVEPLGWSEFVGGEWKMMTNERWRVVVELTWDKSPEDIKIMQPDDAAKDFGLRGFERLRPHLNALQEAGIIAHYHVTEEPASCFELD